MKAQSKALTENRHAIFLQIITILWRYDDAGLREIADKAGCHWVTLYSWKSGRTMFPRLDKIAAVAYALGYELTLVKQKSVKPVPVLRRVK